VNAAREPAVTKEQRVARAAKSVFLKYGYNRVTMSDLAEAAGMSRPALYLVFPKKEDVFRAVVRQIVGEISAEVHERIGSIRSPLEKLKFVCERWTVQTFDWSRQSPEAKEIFESSQEFAQDAIADSMVLFERDLTTAIELLPKGSLPRGISQKQAMHLLAGAIQGIKHTCASSSELRDKIHALIAMMIRPPAT
jgi:AcrR family transcriptional regulator